MPAIRPLHVCLAGSGGGHVRQLLDLEPAWKPYDSFFLTEDTALSRSIAEKHPTHFVPHIALGQARLGHPLKMAAAAVRNLIASARIMLRTRPDVYVTTGAGAAFFGLVIARLLGARIVLIESFARFDKPSVFARLAWPFAHHKVVQSAALAGRWPDAKVFDPLKLLDAARPDKKALVFGTVGATLPFPRLVDMMVEAAARGAIPETMLIQTGIGARDIDGVETRETIPFDELQAILRDADIVICHGGSGSLITALRNGCRVISVPRLFRLGEVYDNHQEEITGAFAARGLISVANTADELCDALEQVRSRAPVLATSEPLELIGYLNEIFASEMARRGRRPGALDLTRPRQL